ncbi:MAG: tetratricopeptide repeat protein [Prevotellaceae bacterium]|nr:tetratricopeptide repeat protein [Prevotellaceae bacterium]
MKTLTAALILALSPLLASAQPSWLKNARRGIVTLYALQQKGDTLSCQAFFADSDGTLLSPLKPLQQASRAWAVDEKGTRYEVTRIGGFNSTYNVAKLLCDVSKKKPSPLRANRTPLTEEQTVYHTDGEEDHVAKVEKANDHAYYTLEAKADPSLEGSPLLNQQGEAVAIVQTPLQASGSPFYALGISLALSLETSAMDVNSSDLQYCSIPKQLPREESQAKSFMYLCQADTQTKVACADDFISAYPQSPSGYAQKAECLAEAGRYAEAETAYSEGLRAKVSDQHELLYSRANTVYQLCLEGKQLPEGWTLESALQDIRRAKETSPLPLYTLSEARILYALKDYEGAARCFTELTTTNMRSPDVFIYIAQCLENTGAPKEELLALNDSAVACFSKPYTSAAADYLWLRASTLKDLGRYRDAISDLNDYEHLLSGSLTAAFYYQREQLELETRMLAQAINDIQKAIELSPTEALYHAEQAVVLYRVGETDEAMKSCRRAIELDPTFPDPHRILAVCLSEKGNTAEARTELQRAIDLGDELAQGLLEKLN